MTAFRRTAGSAFASSGAGPRPFSTRTGGCWRRPGQRVGGVEPTRFSVTGSRRSAAGCVSSADRHEDALIGARTTRRSSRSAQDDARWRGRSRPAARRSLPCRRSRRPQAADEAGEIGGRRGRRGNGLRRGRRRSSPARRQPARQRKTAASSAAIRHADPESFVTYFVPEQTLVWWCSCRTSASPKSAVSPCCRAGSRPRVARHRRRRLPDDVQRCPLRHLADVDRLVMWWFGISRPPVRFGVFQAGGAASTFSTSVVLPPVAHRLKPMM